MEGPFQRYGGGEVCQPLHQRRRRWVPSLWSWDSLPTPLITAFAASVWVNNVFLNTSFGKFVLLINTSLSVLTTVLVCSSTNNRRILEETDDKFTFPSGSLHVGEDNVITIVQDNMGLNETGCEWALSAYLLGGRRFPSDPSLASTNAPKSPRGVRGFKLDTGTFGEWKVQGKIGGYAKFVPFLCPLLLSNSNSIPPSYPDKVRGVLNEGGLFGEREGWHLPGFETSSWTRRPLSSGLPDGAAGVGFFVTTFDLNLPEGTDVPLSFTFDDGLPMTNGVSGQPYRAIFFVNGWMMGKRVANLG